MEILIDESGSFTAKGAATNSWCVVASYVTPESEKRKYREALRKLKLRNNCAVQEEIKLYEIDENEYFNFLNELNKQKGVLFCVATDTHFNTEELIDNHKNKLASSILSGVDKMLYEGGKEALRYLTSQIDSLSNQLYTQMVCQIILMLEVVNRGICYFVQRYPNTLKSFKWRVDQKEPAKKLNYEDAFEKLSPALLQTFSLEEPMPALNWCDYRPMREYIYGKGEIPEYLVEKFPHLKDEEGYDIQKIVRKDIKFLDSRSVDGIQIADLLASGVRRVLKRGFADNETAARLLGGLMVQEKSNSAPIGLVSLNSKSYPVGESKELVKIMIASCRAMVKK